MTPTSASGLRATADATPEKVAIVDGSRRLTFAELDDRVDRLAQWLRRAGAGPAGGVVLALRTSIEAIESWLACGRLGVTAALVPAGSTAAELAYFADDAAAAVVIGEADVAGRAPGRADLRTGDAYERALESIGAGRLGDPVTPEWPDVRPYTSGTTGRPKAVIHRGRFDPAAMLDATRRYLARHDVGGPGDVHLVCTPFHHVSAWCFAPPAVLLGQTVVVLRRFEPHALLALVEAERVTWLYLVPTHMTRLATLPVDAGYDLSSVRALHHGASPCPAATKTAMIERFGPVVWEHYGGTEGGFASCSSAEWLAHPGTVGRAVENTEVAAFADDGRQLGAGEIGLLYARATPGAFYYDRSPEATAAAWRDGWFTLGDVGYVDEDGYVFLVDRAKDVIVTGGANVYPAEVERVLLQHPAVADAVVVGAPDDDRGEIVQAVVVTDAPVTAADLVAHCAVQLVAYKLPRAVDFVDALPRNALGKILRREVRDAYWSARATRI